MATPAPELVIFDLDGTLLDSDRIVQQVIRGLVERRGYEYTSAIAKSGLGMRPQEATVALIAAAGGLGGASADEVRAEASGEMQKLWPACQLMPGAARVLKHLTACGVPLALATSAPSHSYQAKVAAHQVLQPTTTQGSFSVVVTGDQVEHSKPHPEIFLRAMELSGVTTDPSKCVVVEDAPAGVNAARAAGMQVVCVPSLRFGQKKADPADFATPAAAAPSTSSSSPPSSSSSTSKASPSSSSPGEPSPPPLELLGSLLDWCPESVGLPPFQDRVGEVTPLDQPWRAKGIVVKGFGRGSKSLGIPTANLPPEAWDQVEGGVPAQTSGIYVGWASVGDDPTVYPTALSVGWNPHFEGETNGRAGGDHHRNGENKGVTASHSGSGKTLEPWLLHDFGHDFYGQELRLVVCGYIRPEAPFTTLNALVARIHQDAAATKHALGLPPHRTPDGAVVPPIEQKAPKSDVGSGNGGGDGKSGSGDGDSGAGSSTRRSGNGAASTSANGSSASEWAAAQGAVSQARMRALASDPYLRPPGFSRPPWGRLLLQQPRSLLMLLGLVYLTVKPSSCTSLLPWLMLQWLVWAFHLVVAGLTYRATKRAQTPFGDAAGWFMLGFLRGQPVIAEAKKLAEPRIAEDTGPVQTASTNNGAQGSNKKNKNKKKQ